MKKKEVESERKETFSLAFGSRQESLSHSSERDGGVASGGKNPEGGTRESLSIRSLHHDDDAAPMLLPGKKNVTAALSLPCVYVSPFWCLKPDIIKEAPSKEAERTERHSRVRGEVEKASGKKKKKSNRTTFSIVHTHHSTTHRLPLRGGLFERGRPLGLRVDDHCSATHLWLLVILVEKKAGTTEEELERKKKSEKEAEK